MRLSFFGAAGEVTGSCTLVETSRARVLVDFGLHQGATEAQRRNQRLPPIDPGRLDAVVLTHAHLDHSGRLPVLAGRTSYAGPIHATPATIDLCEVMLRDAANVQAMDAERFSRQRLRRGRDEVRPLYGQDEVTEALRRMARVPYGEARPVAPGVTARFVDAGHILGSASVELTVEDDGRRRVIAFSGDIGPRGAPLLRDPMPILRADVMLLESTYGDRDHRSREATIDELVGILDAARTPGGRVLIPAFAVGRAQQLIFHLGRLHYGGRFKGRSVYVDSPMAIEATTLYRRHRDLFDAESWAIITGGGAPLNFPGLRLVRTTEESRGLNRVGDGAVIIAGSGMCTGGRILHHLKHSLWREETHVVMVGYQAEGTLGRRLVDGQSIVRVMGEPIAVKARVHTLGGLSAHAGQSGLVEWAATCRTPEGAGHPRIVLNHGEERARAPLAERLRRELGCQVITPGFGQALEV